MTALRPPRFFSTRNGRNAWGRIREFLGYIRSLVINDFACHVLPANCIELYKFHGNKQLGKRV